MRILLTTLIYPPRDMNGTITLHYLLKFLKSQGHEVRVFRMDIPVTQSYNYDGIEVFGNTGNQQQYQWADIIFTQLYATNETIARVMPLNIPIVHFIHSTINESYTNLLKGIGGNNHVVYNSNWVKDHFSFPLNSFVFYPPCDPSYYNVCSNPIINEYITLISLNYNKGVKQFYEIAKRMPERKFLGVSGNDPNDQVLESIPNVRIIPNTTDIREVYKLTRLLLMPSLHESWGRTATEAALNGIPVICTQTKGLRENMGKAAVYIKDRDDIEEWVRRIKSFDGIEKQNIWYYKKSKQGRERGLELDPAKYYREFENFLNKIIYN